MFFQISQWPLWLSNLINNGFWGYARGLNLILWLIAIGLMYVAGGIFILRTHRKEIIISQIWLYRSFALFFMIMGLTRISFLLGYTFQSDYNFYLALGYMFGAISFLPMFFTLEHFIIVKTHKIFSIIGIILALLGIYFAVFSYDSAMSLLIQDIGMPILAGCFAILYIWLITQTTGTVQEKDYFDHDWILVICNGSFIG